MQARRLLVPALALVMGLASPAFADEWAAKGAIAEAWFLGLAPIAVEAAGPRWAWLAASAAYTVQFLALFAVMQPVLEPFARLLRPPHAPSLSPAPEDRRPGSGRAT
jgi:hypothetical protein